MRRLFYILSALTCAIVLATTAQAQNSPAAGNWDVALNTPGGVRNFKATFKVDGDKLTGALKGERGELPIQGTTKGNEVKFSYTVKYMDNDLVITMTGNVDGDTIKGTADFGGFAQDEWNAKREGATAAAASAPAAAQPSTPATSGEKVDVTGTWNFEVETSAGSGNPTFNLKQDGEKLTGRYKGALGEADLTGTVKGNQVEFSFKITGQVEGTVVYSGTTDGKTMKGKAKFAELGEGTFTGKKQ
jgi:hypothetical protein